MQIKAVTLNVRGLNGSIKRRSTFRWLHNQNAHFYFLQETYSDEKSKAVWEAEWGGGGRFSAVTAQNIAKA